MSWARECPELIEERAMQMALDGGFGAAIQAECENGNLGGYELIYKGKLTEKQIEEVMDKAGTHFFERMVQ